MGYVLGVIGGSGLYQMPGLEDVQEVVVDTPWGAPSDQILTGSLNGTEMAFLPRHGRGHVHSPTSVPYRANIDALKRLGCTDIIAVSAVGSLRADYKPGDVVKGNVTKITNFGVFVGLEDGLEGLLHISELSEDKIENAEDLVKVGDPIEVKILRVDTDDRKIGLSKKRVGWSSEREAAEGTEEV